MPLPLLNLTPLPTPHAAMQSTHLAVTLIVVMLVWVALSARSGQEMVQQLLQGTVAHKERGSFAQNNTSEKGRMQLALLVQYFLLQGIALNHAGCHIDALLPQLTLTPALRILLLAVGAMVFYLLQWLLYRLLAFLFDPTRRWEMWLDSFTSATCLTSILLLPTVLLQLFTPSVTALGYLSVGVIYLLGRLLFIYNGVKIFFVDIYSVCYFILYLCTVEIAPLVFLAKGLFG